MAGLQAIVIDCERAAPLARFWAAAMDGYAVRPYDDEEIARLAGLGHTPDTDPMVAVDGPGPTLHFQEVPERKTVKNRVHLDLTTADPRAECDRLVTLGAMVATEYDDHTLMLDPEGNEFCVCQL
jgi:hypothetical protein